MAERKETNGMDFGRRAECTSLTPQPCEPGRKETKGGRHVRSRRKHIDDLLASCAAEISMLECRAAQEIEASEQQAWLLQNRVSFPSSASFSPSSGGTTSCEQKAAMLNSENKNPDISCSSGEQSIRIAQKPLKEDLQPKDVDEEHVGKKIEFVVRKNLDTSQQNNEDLRKALDLNAMSRQDQIQPRIDSGTGHRSKEKRKTVEIISGIMNGDSVTRGSSTPAPNLLERLAHDNTVMEFNLQEYDAALRSTIEEVSRLTAEVIKTERVCKQVCQQEDLLKREAHVHAQLYEENLVLLKKNHELRSVIQEATHADTENEITATVEGLIQQNDLLRSVLFCSEPPNCGELPSRSTDPYNTISIALDGQVF